MVHRLMEQRLAVDSYFVEFRRDLLLSADDWALLEELDSFLKPFTEYSKMLCRDDAPLSLQIAMYKILKAEVVAYKGRFLKEECKRMLALIETKFSGLENYRYEISK